jgi:hypothetical protein
MLDVLLPELKGLVHDVELSTGGLPPEEAPLVHPFIVRN